MSSGTKKISWILSIFLGFMLACAAPELPKITAHPTSQYPYFKDIDGLSIAIDPYFEMHKVEHVFGMNLLSKGILPIFMVVENHSQSTYLIQKNKIYLYPKDLEKQETKISDTKPLLKDKKEKIESGKAFLIAQGVIAPVIVSPILFFTTLSIVASEENKYQKIVQNLIKSELPDQTLFHEESSYGFIYLSMGVSGKFDLKQPLTLYVEAKNLLDGKTLEFTFNILQIEIKGK